MPLTPCPECGREVSTTAESCPQCGAPVLAAQATQPKFRNSLGCNIVGWSVLVVLVLGMIGGFLEECDSGSEDSSGASGPRGDYLAPAITVSAEELVAAYEGNAIAAGERFDAQWVIVTGIIQSISKDILGDPYVTLEGDASGIGSVQCMLADDAVQWGAARSAGETVALRGRVDGKLMNILVRECIPA